MRCRRNGRHDSPGAARSLNFDEESLLSAGVKNQQLPVPAASSPAVPCTSRTALMCNISPIGAYPTICTLETITHTPVEDSGSVKKGKQELGIKVSNFEFTLLVSLINNCNFLSRKEI